MPIVDFITSLFDNRERAELRAEGKPEVDAAAARLDRQIKAQQQREARAVAARAQEWERRQRKLRRGG